jgi:hypothetical protein
MAIVSEELLLTGVFVGVFYRRVRDMLMESGPGGRQIQVEDPDGNPTNCSRLPDD